MSQNNNDLGAFLAGFVLGGLAGAAAALLMAPQSGADTRAQIASKGDEVVHTGEARLHEYRDAAGTAYAGAQERARIVLDEGKSKLGGAKGDAQPVESVTEEDVEGADETGDVTA